MGKPFGKILTSLGRGIKAIIFPNVCICCGVEVTRQERQICSFCLSDRFEDANPRNRSTSSNTLLPEGVIAQHALWKYDKGGTLQKLLHQLKYDRLAEVGIQLGNQVGYRLEKHPDLHDLLVRHETILVPVPLHFLSYMRRGFNQAYLIARGIRGVWNIPICDIRAVVRCKNTRSQTGFSLQQRTENMKDAFLVRDKEIFAGKLALIVDDVFTTGSTSFELSKVLLNAGAYGVVILTVAQA